MPAESEAQARMDAASAQDSGRMGVYQDSARMTGVSYQADSGLSSAGAASYQGQQGGRMSVYGGGGEASSMTAAQSSQEAAWRVGYQQDASSSSASAFQESASVSGMFRSASGATGAMSASGL